MNTRSSILLALAVIACSGCCDSMRVERFRTLRISPVGTTASCERARVVDTIGGEETWTLAPGEYRFELGTESELVNGGQLVDTRVDVFMQGRTYNLDATVASSR